MKKKSTSKSAFFNLRVLTGIFVLLAGVCMALFGFSMLSRAFAQAKQPRNENDTSHEDPGARVAWERLRLQDQHGRVSADMLQRASEYKKTMPYRPEAWAEFAAKNSIGQPEAVQSIWTSIGPGNIGGRTRSIIIHPSNPNIIWLGAVGGGIWKTTNGGNSWTTNTDFLANLAVDCMAMDPTNSNVLYAGTGEPYPGDGILGNGIFTTADGGTTWAQLSLTGNNPDFYDVTRLAVAFYSPVRSRILLAATTTGLFRTNLDAARGISWAQVGTGRYNTVVFQPNNAANCLASSGLLSSDNIGVFRSTDTGTTWASSTFTGGPTLTGRIELAYAKSNPNIVYASADSPATGPQGKDEGALFKSTDGGQHFAWTGIKGTLYYFGWYANTLWIDPINPYVVVVGSTELFRCTSTDGGTTFSKVQISGDGHLDTHVDHHVVINDPNYDGSSNKRVYVGSDGGIYKTDDILRTPQSPSWTALNHTLGITQFYGGAANSDGSIIIGGTQDNGTVRYQSQLGSEGWDYAIGGDGGFCAVGGGYFYGEAGSYGLQFLWRSSDGSSANRQYINHWGGNPVDCSNCPNCLSCNCSSDSNSNFAAPLVLDPNNPSTLLGGIDGLERSLNANTPNPHDVSWTLIKCPLQGDKISAIAIAPGKSDIIWVGYNSGALYFTTNGTATSPTWTKVNAPALPQRYVESIAFAGWRPGLWNTVYVAFGGNDYDQGFNANNLWNTGDGGGTWTNISNGLPNVPVSSVVTSQSPSFPSYLYIGTAIGVFASTNNGTNWSPGIAGDVPANVWVNQLFWTNSSRTLVAVTHGRGMFTANTQ
jgi:hypothetical protein